MTVTTGAVLVEVDAMAAEILAGLHASCFTPAWDADTFRDLLAMPGCVAHLATVPTSAGTEPVGFVLVRSAAQEAEILSVGVIRPWRGRGIGVALVTAAAATAQIAGAEALFLEVEVSNAPARRLYAHLGFAAVGERKGYYQRADRPPGDALVLRVGLPLAMGPQR